MAWAEHEKKMKSSPIMRSEQPNRYILLVNDHKAIHDDFLEILQPQVEPTPSRLDSFQVDCVDQGGAGLALARGAREEGFPVCGGVR